MKRVLIIGSAGAGKSTLSRKLSHLIEVPVIHLDRYYWQPNWVATPNDEWDEVVKSFAEQEAWIMDGNYSRTLDLRISRADTVIFLDAPRLLCMYRIIKRRMQYQGRTRPDLNEQCPEKLDWSFIVWVWNYRKRNRPTILRKLEAIEGEKTIIIAKSRKEVEALLEQIRKDQADTAPANSATGSGSGMHT
ncbi:DNA topology modulation protein [Paenibacillus sp. 2TAB19]|uniref:DNA topology modulation protein n=1 Tax=Paenibacillus sp. 2TAB19 TaxID=3233003 RepID=UPI003F9B5A49